MARKTKIKNAKGANISLNTIKLGQKYQAKINEKRAVKREKILKKEYIKQKGTFGVQETVGEFHSARMRKYGGETAFTELNSVRFNVDAFQNEAQAKRRVETLRKMNTKKYENLRHTIYKQNLIKSIRTKFGNLGDKEVEDVIKKVKRMSKEELAEFAYTTEVYNIDFVYGNPETQENFNAFMDMVNDYYANKYKKQS